MTGWIPTHHCPDCNDECDCPMFDDTGICEGCERPRDMTDAYDPDDTHDVADDWYDD
jgi:hypothetical protein